MKKKCFFFVIVLIHLSTLQVFGSQKLFEYGFENWTGDRNTTQNYPFSSSEITYCNEHTYSSEVVTSYGGILPHTGNYFFLQNDSPAHPLNPSVPGITIGEINANNNIGLNGSACSTADLNLSDLTTGEIFVSFWAVTNKGFGSVSNGGRCKWIVMSPVGTGGTVYMHLGTDKGADSVMYFYNGDEGYWLGSGITLKNANDGNWHKYSFYVSWNTGTVMGWYDVTSETVLNYTKSYTAPDGTFGSGIGPHHFTIQNNFSAAAPTEMTYHAIDDIEIWDGMPNQEEPEDDPVGPPGDASNFTAQPGDCLIALSWTNPTDIDFAGTMIRYRTDGTYPVNHNDGALVCNRTIDNFTHRNNVVNGVTYYYSAFTYDEVPNYSEAAHARATPQEGVGGLSPPSGMTGLIHLWNAEAQTGDSSWSNSGVTWCVRVLVQGESITSPGSQVCMGFQGRTSGDYTIRKVSIAERDMNGAEGDVMNSTWTRVTFDGRSTATWANDQVTVPEGAIKRSDSMSLYITPEKDYYVTFLLESPSVYLIAPSGYRELYFDGADHTDDVDWSGNGHSTRPERLHAFSSIDVVFE